MRIGSPPSESNESSDIPLLRYALFFLLCVEDIPTPPEAPKFNYKHANVVESKIGEKGGECWIFEPSEPKPEGKRPLVIFLHGWGGMLPASYRSWIDHLVKRGNVVVYPRYQATFMDWPENFMPNAISAINDAIKRLGVKADLEKVTVIGHSIGAAMTAMLAGRAKEVGLPEPRAIMINQPFGPMKLRDVLNIPEKCLMVVTIGEHDTVAPPKQAKAIFLGAKNVKEKAFVTFFTDKRGAPALKANHLAPCAGKADALDFDGFWRIFDAMCEQAFAGKPLEVDNSLGKWSDGTPVKELEVLRSLD